MTAEYPIDVGTMLFTLVDPQRGHEVAYNRWYERDHFYAGCMIGPGILAGSRWVATRSLKDLRFPASSPFAEPVDAGSYLAVYWINRGQDEQWGTWASDQVWWLYQNGRGFDQRSHAQTGLYDHLVSTSADDHQVPTALALDHRYASLLVVVVEPTGDRGSQALADALHAGPVASLFATAAASLASSWAVKTRQASSAQDDTGAPAAPAAQTAPMALGAGGGSPHRVVQLLFSERDPVEVWDHVAAYAVAISETGLGRVSFAAPFIPTDVGTDRYTDELW